MRILKEPLLHFLALGALIFLVYSWLQGPVRPPATIDVSVAVQENLAAAFARTWQRPPTPEEMAGLIREHVREELAYREAQRIGLDQDDIIVRRRMRQKLELLTDELVARVPPDEATLRVWFDERAADYRQPAVLSFRQVYFNVDDDLPAAEAAAQGLLLRLQANDGDVDIGLAGDRSMLPPASSNVTEDEIAARFGRAFADRLVELPPGEWLGPLRSGFGIHLVRIDTRFEGRVPEFREVRAAVERDWFAETRRLAMDAYYERLAAQYDVVVAPRAMPATP